MRLAHASVRTAVLRSAIPVASASAFAPPAASVAAAAPAVILVVRFDRRDKAAILVLQNIFDDLPGALGRDFVGFPIVGRQGRRRGLDGRRNFLMWSAGDTRARGIAFRLRGFVAFVLVIFVAALLYSVLFS